MADFNDLHPVLSGSPDATLSQPISPRQSPTPQADALHQPARRSPGDLAWAHARLRGIALRSNQREPLAGHAGAPPVGVQFPRSLVAHIHVRLPETRLPGYPPYAAGAIHDPAGCGEAAAQLA